MKSHHLLLNKLETISHILKKNYKNERYLGCLAGIAGFSLFEFQYTRFLKSDISSEIAEEMLVKCFNDIDENSSPDYCTGMAGIGWITCFLKENDFIDLNTDELLEPLDLYLYTIMMKNAENDYHDFTNGSIGYGLYFLKRFTTSANGNLKKRYENYLLDLIHIIKKHSIQDGESIKWNSLINREKGTKGINLSLPHGMISILNFLSMLYVNDTFKSEVQDLIKGGVSFLMDLHSNRLKETISLYPNYIPDELNAPSRMGWCYGDLCIGITIWKIGKVLKDPNLADFSIEILTHSSKRRDLELNRVIDSSICHGAFGIAQVFNRMYKETSQSHFKETATFWINEGLKMATFEEDDFAGFKQWTGDETGWQGRLSILEGLSGIGLCIIDYLDFDASKWDECLLLS